MGKKAGLGILASLGLVGIFFFGRRGKAKAQPGNIVLSNLVISPSQVYVGQPVTISLVATNTGGEKATLEMILEVI